MSKIDTELKLASWVRWIAQDADGRWWGFEIEPNQSYCGWYENEIGRYIQLAQEKPDIQWRTTLRRIQ